jgi:leucine-zipper of insertion element IS481
MRLTAQGRHLLVRRVEELGWRMVEAVKAAGISQRQGYRWLARHRSGGSAELGDRSSAPKCCKHRVAARGLYALANAVLLADQPAAEGCHRKELTLTPFFDSRSGGEMR